MPEMAWRAADLSPTFASGNNHWSVPSHSTTPNSSSGPSALNTPWAQSRATWISGSRDDFEPQDYRAIARARRTETGRDWLDTNPATRFRDAPTLENASIRKDLEQAARLLARVGLTQILAVDLTDPSIGISVARIVVPGLEGVYQTEGYIPGLRGQQLLARRQ